jgi:single-stranded-DNA-specific exonuclease
MQDAFDLKNIHPLTRTLLQKRGVAVEDMMDFLNPSYEKHIGDPFGIYGMDKAVSRIVDAIRNGETICIYSDYDCDGIPGGVLLREFFDGIGYPVDVYVPHRHNEGYGVHIHAIDALKAKGVTLIITVDSGITNIEEVAYAKTVGVDFVVTDHHLPIHEEGKGQVVPDAVAVLNSKQDLCTYHDDMLCGCAVAWKLACAILMRLRELQVRETTGLDGTHTFSAENVAHSQLPASESPSKSVVSLEHVLDTVSKLPVGWEKWMLDLVGISTIADMVPLQKENRALAHYGLKVLRKTKRPGLLHIFNEQRMRKDYLTEDDIAFTIAPRVNAASRMGTPIQAHHMLYERNSAKAESYARDLELLNTERKAGVKDIISTLSFDHTVYQNDVIVVGDMSWGPGILGLIAQNIIDETGKPTFVWGFGSSQSTAEGIVSGEEKNAIKGSCRSLGDIHVVELMARVKEMFPGILLASGGHEGAGGFSVDMNRISELSDALNEAVKHVVVKEIGSQEIAIDADLQMDDVHEVTYKAIELLAPFGEGNPKPVFSFGNITPLATKRFGKKNEHLEIIYPTTKGGKVKAIQFFTKSETEEKAVKPHTLLAHLEKSYFAGKTELRLRIVDIR